MSWQPIEKKQPVAWMTHSQDILPLFHKTHAGALCWGAEPVPLYALEGWQPIETAPKDGREILVYEPMYCTIGQWVDSKHGGAWWIEGGQITGHPTHWMPLPPPPEKTE